MRANAAQNVNSGSAGRMIRVVVPRASFVRWRNFAAFSLTVVLLLALRPIPSTDANNDTGRYIFEMKNYCGGQFDDLEGTLRGFEFGLMYDLTGSCIFGSDRFFLFVAALTVPAAYLCFAHWRRGDGLIAQSAMFSVSGIELMTNALRNGFSVFLFLGALRIGGERLFASSVLFGVSLLLHSSTFIYFPLLYYIWLSSPNRRKAHLLAFVIVLLAGVLMVASPSTITGVLLTTSDLSDRYRDIYALEVNASFILFMIAPLYAIFIARLLLDRLTLTRLESFSILYSSVLIVSVFLLFPYITYRFAITSAAIQLFVITFANARSTVADKVVFGTLTTHLVIMLVTSNNFRGLWE